MNRSQVNSFLESAVNALSAPVPQYGRGRITEFNSLANKKYPSVWFESGPVSGGFAQGNSQMPIDNWEIKLHIAKKDTDDSLPDQYEAIVDQCDTIAQKLMYQINQVISGYATITIDSFTREPFYKLHSDCLTGVLLSFTLNDPDQTSVCS